MTTISRFSHALSFTHKMFLWAEFICIWIPACVLFLLLASGIINHQPILIPAAVLGVASFYGVFRAFLYLLIDQPIQLTRLDYRLLGAGFIACNYIIVAWSTEGPHNDVAGMLALFVPPQILGLKLLGLVYYKNVSSLEEY